ncbi:MAG: endonuclease/exonuclease/phosphatase family protein [Croceimicrobium sp.]
MKKLILLLCLPIIVFAQESPFNPAAVFPAKHKFDTGDTLRIMTWNVEHLIDDIDDPYVNNRRENEASLNPEKLQLLAKALKLANADVVVFQEAESANAIEAMSDSFFKGLDYTYFSDARSRNWYQNVVIMSKLPLGRITAYGNVHTPVIVFGEDGEKNYQTQNYINTRIWTCELIVNPDFGIHLSGAHLKAGGGERNRAMRLAQINYWQEEMKRLCSAEPLAKIILLGDLNSYRDGPEIASLLNYEHPLVQLSDPLAPEINTHPSDEPKRRLDYILYNQNLDAAVIKESAQVFQPFNAADMRIISDHLPIIMDIIVR